METGYRKSEHSTRLDELSSDRGDSMFPETQLELMLGKKTFDASRKSWDPDPKVITIDQSKLMILEDRFTVMQKRNVVLITENESLRSRLKYSTDKIVELEEANAKKSSLDGIEKPTRELEDREIATAERGIQVWQVCRSCCREELENGSSLVEPTAIVTKTELERLERDMRKVKEALVVRESDWDRAIERENSYREQLKRLAAESMTSRQLLDSRHAELERLAQTLAETERELRSARKEIFAMKKTIQGQEKRQRDRETKCTTEHREMSAEEAGVERNDDKESEYRFDDIATELSNARNKQRRRKLFKDKTIYASRTNSSSEPISPRSLATADRTIDEQPHLTITPISRSKL